MRVLLIVLSFLFIPVANAQLTGTDTLPGSSCSGFPDGATRVTADVNLDGENVILVCDGTTWNASGGSGLWVSGAGDDIYVDAPAPEVGINTTSPAYTLDVNGSLRVASQIVLDPIGGAAAPAFYDLSDLSSVTLTSPANGEMLQYDGSAWVNTAGGGGMWSGGAGDDIYYSSGSPQVGIGKTNPVVALDIVGDINYTGVIVDVSDIRMKYDVVPLQNPLAKMTSLNGFAFKMKGDDQKTVEYGISAQAVQKVFPELVHQIDENGTLGVAYDGLFAPMIEAMKEQQEQIKELQAEIEILKQNQRRSHNDGEL